MVSFHLVKESTENIVRLFLMTSVDILTLIRISIACALSLVTLVHGGCTSRWPDDPSRYLRAFHAKVSNLRHLLIALTTKEKIWRMLANHYQIRKQMTARDGDMDPSTPSRIDKLCFLAEESPTLRYVNGGREDAIRIPGMSLSQQRQYWQSVGGKVPPDFIKLLPIHTISEIRALSTIE